MLRVGLALTLALIIVAAPYIPEHNSELLASGVLTEFDKIYVGRSYDPCVDPFPEYNYDYTGSDISHSIDLEQLADRSINDLLGLASEDAFSFNLGPTPLNPFPGSPRKKIYSGVDDQVE